MGTYRRVLLKLSGESLGGPAGKGIDENWLAAYAEEVAQAVKNGLQVAIVIGGSSSPRQATQRLGRILRRSRYGRGTLYEIVTRETRDMARSRRRRASDAFTTDNK